MIRVHFSFSLVVVSQPFREMGGDINKSPYYLLARAGKSVLAASVIDALKNSLEDGEVLAYFYATNGPPTSQKCCVHSSPNPYNYFITTLSIPVV